MTTFLADCADDLNYCALEYYENNFDGLALGVNNDWTKDTSKTTTFINANLGIYFPNEKNVLSFYMGLTYASSAFTSGNISFNSYFNPTTAVSETSPSTATWLETGRNPTFVSTENAFGYQSFY